MPYVYPAGDLKYVTWSGNGTTLVVDGNGNAIDFSKFGNLHVFALQISTTGSPTNCQEFVESGYFKDSTDDNDWFTVITFTAVTSWASADKQPKVGTLGHMPYLRVRRTFSGGSSPTVTGYVLIRGIDAGYPV